MRVLGISVWIHFIWIFVVGVLLFFHTVHGNLFEGFVVTSGSGSGSLGSAPAAAAIQSYSATTGTWVPLTGDTDRLLYQQRLPKGARLVSPNRNFVLLYKANGDLILYDTRDSQIMWKTATGSDSNYIMHQGQFNVRKINGTLGLTPFAIPPDPLAGASGSSGSNAGSTPTGQYFTTSYLQLKDNANLVINKADGTPIWSTNTGSIENTVVCEPQIISYPFVQSDCITLDNMIKSYNDTINTIKGTSGSGTNTSGTNTSGTNTSGTNTSGSGSGSTGTLMNTATGGLSQLIAAKQGICTVQPYYNDLGCREYLATVSIAPTTTAAVTPIVEPSVSIKGTINMGTKIITVTGILSSATIQSGDIIYLGYGVSIEGPFTVASVSGQTITLTKNYIGATITNAVISVKRVTRGSDTLLTPSSSPVQMDISKLPPYMCTPFVDHGGDDILCTTRTEAQVKSACDSDPTCLAYNVINDGRACTKTKSNITAANSTITNFCVKTLPTDLIASVYPDQSFIVIDTSTATVTADVTTISDSLPLNLDLGDIIYIKKDTCNTYDIDNGNGTCTAYLCKIGEVDMGNNTCKPYSCGTTNTNTGTTATPTIVTDTDNGDGTCTTQIIYSGCRTDFTYNATTKMCDGRVFGKNLSYSRIVRVQRAIYDKILMGIAGTQYTKINTNPSYTYSKTLGPYIVAMKSSTNKIMIKSFQQGDLNTSGGFILNPTASSHRARRLWLSNTRTGTPPPLVDTVNLKALPESGLVNVKLYKVDYLSFRNISIGIMSGSWIGKDLFISNTRYTDLNVKVYMVQDGIYTKMVANDTIRTAKYYMGSIDDYSPSRWSSYTTAGVSAEGRYMATVNDTSLAIKTTQYSATLTYGVSSTSTINTYVTITNPNITIGLRYSLSLSVKVVSGTVNNTSPGIKLEDNTNKVYAVTDNMVSKGLDGYVYLSNIYTTVKWDFTATGTGLQFRIQKSSTNDVVVLEFNMLDIVNIAGYTGAA